MQASHTPSKAFQEVVQQSRKEIKNLIHILLVNFTAALSNPYLDQVTEFDYTLYCIYSLLEFYLIAEYSSHNNVTLRYIEQYFVEFHKDKSIFTEFRTMKAIKVMIKNIQKVGSEGIAAIRNNCSLSKTENVNRSEICRLKLMLKSMTMYMKLTTLTFQRCTSYSILRIQFVDLES